MSGQRRTAAFEHHTPHHRENSVRRRIFRYSKRRDVFARVLPEPHSQVDVVGAGEIPLGKRAGLVGPLACQSGDRRRREPRRGEGFALGVVAPRVPGSQTAQQYTQGLLHV